MKGRSETGGVARRVAFAFVLLVAVATIAAAFLETFCLKARLSKMARERVAARLSTAPFSALEFEANEYSRARLGAKREARPELKLARDARLAAEAAAWTSVDSGRSETSRRRDAIKGLARWNVDATIAAPFLRNSEEFALFESTERLALTTERERTERASKEASAAISELALDEIRDASIEDALAFLDELGGAVSFENEMGSDGELESAFLWIPEKIVGAPIDSAAFVVDSDFIRNDEAAIAARACRASSWFFLLTTLGLTPFGRPARALSVAFALLAARVARLRMGTASSRDFVRGRAEFILRRDATTAFLTSVRLLI